MKIAKAKRSLPEQTKKAIKALVAHYEEQKPSFDNLVESLAKDILRDPKIGPLIHSVKFRSKSPESLSKKLTNKALKALNSNRKFSITPGTLYQHVTDLAGIRILHLHPKQMVTIKPLLEAFLDERNYKTVELIAYTWDEEYKLLFEDLGYRTEFKPSMYTSLHHVVIANTKSKIRCEIQIRTLMEEVWGEVDHKINYKDPSCSLACKEQLKALARMASAGTRLVDSIYASRDEHLGISPPKIAKPKASATKK